EIDLTSVTLENGIDGCMIKLFYYNDKWNVSTHRKINASTNWWSSNKSFEIMFYDACKEKNFNFDILNKSCTYTFILIHPENRIILNYGNTIDLFHVSTRDNITFNEYLDDIGIK